MTLEEAIQLIDNQWDVRVSKSLTTAWEIIKQHLPAEENCCEYGFTSSQCSYSNACDRLCPLNKE